MINGEEWKTKLDETFKKVIKKVKIDAEPISEDRSKDRVFEHKIIVNKEFIIYINNEFSELWLDDTNQSAFFGMRF